MGHEPASSLDVKDANLFRAFQSNLLSLISHELRTPLTGVLNALSLLEEGDAPLSKEELIKMARQNAHRLHQTLVALLDVASLESGTFHARLREVDLARLAAIRTEAGRKILQDKNIVFEKEMTPASSSDSSENVPVLADPQKLARSIDLCFQVIAPRVQSGSTVKLGLSSNQIRFTFQLMENMEEAWQSAWSQSVVGFEGGTASPSSVFAGVVQSEQAFLSRAEEGLGSELLLIHEISRLHHGKFVATRQGRMVTLALNLPELSSEEGLRIVLTSRAYQISFELSSVALILIRIPEGVSSARFRDQIKEGLLRTSDAVYLLPKRQQVALVLDDYKPENTPGLIKRMTNYMKQELIFGMAHCPSDGSDPGALLDLAEKRLKELENSKK